IVEQINLNTKQARTFQLVALHSLVLKPEPLRMFLSGLGGTGKSMVINAIRTYFISCSQEHRFRLTSYRGIAARNISGMTLHSALMLNQRSKCSTSSKTNHDLVSMWQGVDYLFIDKISMVGCKTLVQISDALSI
ncbi:hypothetical protein ARMGADRAFT_873035, partial [Armillaria gallica]